MKKNLLLIFSIVISLLTAYATLHIHIWLGITPKYNFSFWSDFMGGIMSFPIGMTWDIQVFMTIPMFFVFMGLFVYISFREFQSSKNLAALIRFTYRIVAFIAMISLVDYSFWSLGDAYVTHDPNWYHDFIHPDPSGHSTGIGWLFVAINIIVFWVTVLLSTDFKNSVETYYKENWSVTENLST